jgi:hypothetical protein
LVEVNALNENPHDNAKLLEFSKESMKLFDALRQLVDFITAQGQPTRLQKFELWFEASAVFWTSNWRMLYLGFIKKVIIIVGYYFGREICILKNSEYTTFVEY